LATGPGTEVFSGFDDPCPEHLLPEAIDGDSGSERMCGIDEPACESESVAGGIGGEWWEDGGNAGFDLFAFQRVFAASENERFTRRGQVLHDHGDGDGRVEVTALFGEVVNLFLDGFQLGAAFGIDGFEEVGTDEFVLLR
jgi:hypothetical protein